ncbi:MAG TPA: isoprenylcysteine carboxylmethyltransferase family protein [Casimicrobiaceae bacterium]|nr:isoprenylcysteine carboxylmethyltransferase family protein [Casimicrobiaceae bacterium]
MAESRAGRAVQSLLPRRVVVAPAPMPDLPALLLAVVMLAYWGRVGVMSVRIRRRTRTLSGVVPEQGLERFLWLFFIPLVAAWLVLPFFAAFRTSGMLAVPEAARGDGWLAVRVLAAGAALALLVATIRCWRRMGRHWKMAVTPGEKQPLITDGPFARVRHPIYGYQILLMLASLCVVPTVPMLVVALVHVVLMVTKARNEERYLTGVHGAAYDAYAARTGRFFPRLSG